MPITQQRMISLINAARDFEQALDFFIKLTITEVRSARQSGSTPQSLESALTNISNYAAKSALLKRPLESSNTLIAEESHFRQRGSRNESEQRRQERRRRERGVQPFSAFAERAFGSYLDVKGSSVRTNAPHSMIRRGSLINEVDLDVAAAQGQRLEPITPLPRDENGQLIRDPTLAADGEDSFADFMSDEELAKLERLGKASLELSKADRARAKDEATKSSSGED